MTTPDPLPILYSFRRCPYAMRARLALKAAGIKVELREVVLRDKPAHMLQLSPKGTVPVLQLEDGRVIDESLDIARWALQKNDPDRLLQPGTGSLEDMLKLIEENDGPFKHHLDRTKYGTRYPEEDPEANRQKANDFLARLNQRLEGQPFLCGSRLSLADITIAPFVRQFANIERERFDKENGKPLITWLEAFLASDLFLSVMQKYPQWQQGDKPTTFPPANQPA